MRQGWYNQISAPATHGTLHQLAAPTNSYVNFIQHVQAVGDEAYNQGTPQPRRGDLRQRIWARRRHLVRPGPAAHDYSLTRHRERVSVTPKTAHQTAAAVYRPPTANSVRSLAASARRRPHVYSLVSTDRDVYFNGIGPIHEFMLPVDQGVDAFVNIDYEARHSARTRWQPLANRQPADWPGARNLLQRRPDRRLIDAIGP